MADPKPLIPTGRETPPSLIRTVGDSVLNLLFPSACLICSVPVSRMQDRGVCGSCWKKVLQLRIAGAQCPLCGLPYQSFEAGDSHLCARCAVRPPPYAGARSFGWYRSELSSIVRGLKFEGRRDLAGLLAPLLASSFFEHWSPGEISLIIPLPLHPRRLRERGFNQAALLAGGLSRLVGVPWSDRVLKRVRATLPQIGLSDRERFQNVDRAFRCRPSSSLEGFRVLLVDDVMTTGATAASACRALLEGGALRVAVLTVARAVVGSE